MTDKVKPAAGGMRLYAAVCAATALALLCGCSAIQSQGLRFPWMHRITVEQGNLYDSEDVAQLEIGMSRSEVLKIMGSPMLRDPLHKNRWDYLYLLQIPEREPIRHHLVLFFDGDSLSEISERTPSPAPRGGRALFQREADASPSGQ